MDTQKPDEVFSFLFCPFFYFILFFSSAKNSDPTHRNVRAAEEEVHGPLRATFRDEKIIIHSNGKLVFLSFSVKIINFNFSLSVGENGRVCVTDILFQFPASQKEKKRKEERNGIYLWE
jgi:hypothetical protein